MTPWRLNVAGEPKAQPRVKAYRRGERAGVYTPGTADSWRELVMLAARQLGPEHVITVPVYMRMLFVFQRPRSHLTKRGEVRPAFACPFVATRGRLDVDNLQKAALDALQSCGVLTDDGLVARIDCAKLYAAPAQRSGVTIDAAPLSGVSDLTAALFDDAAPPGIIALAPGDLAHDALGVLA